MPTLPAPDDTRWLVKTVLSLKQKTIPSAILLTVTFLCNGVTPVIIGRAIDNAIATQDVSALWLWVVVLLATFVVNATAGWFARSLFQRAQLEIGHALRMAVTDRIQDPKGMGGNKRTAGELLSIASTDTQRVADAVFMTVFPVAEVSSVLYVAIMIGMVNVPLGLLVLVGGPLVVWLSLRSAKPLRRRSGVRQEALARASATATDVVQGLRILKGLGAIATVRTRYSAVSDEAYAKTIHANAAQARLNASTETIGSIYIIAISIIAAALAVNGQASVGELITIVGLMQFIITPMTMLGKNIASRWAAAQASAQRVVSVLNAPPAPVGTAPEFPDLKPGITVLGGKDEEDFAALPREKFTVAPHQADLFEGSVLDNVHPDPDVALKALEVAAVEDIPGGPHRSVGENGGNLSGGQRQRVALARAIAFDPEVLILQDPTTAVDSVTEQTIASRVAQFRAGKPTIVYTNAPAWVAQAVNG